MEGSENCVLLGNILSLHEEVPRDRLALDGFLCVVPE
jgi:hypothetical protein